MVELGPFRQVDVEVSDDVATVTIERPDVHNALNVEVMLDLRRAFDALQFRRSVEAVVVTGQGEAAFSSGADLSSYDDEASESEAFQEARARLTFDLARRARSLHAPTVARIQGYCIGAGLILAMYCDLRVAEADASFGLPTTDIGQIPGGGATYRLVELAGEAAAKQLVLTGDLIDAERAASMGLVNSVVPSDDLDAAVESLVGDLRAGGSKATKAAKDSINRQADLRDREAAFEAERRRWWEQFDTEERRRLVEEFRDD
jgi:enoyl-CoA hydratase/carnithine racemase